MFNRASVGFIVEGHGEYNCYPSLFSRIVGASGLNIPCINAGGCGTVVKRLKEQLTDMLLAYSPLTVIITVDLKDILDQGLANSCVELLEQMTSEIESWKSDAKNDPRLDPLPSRIVCVLQIQKFESWLIADMNGLKSSELVSAEVVPFPNAESVVDPAGWLKKNLLIDGCVKTPKIAKQIVSALDPNQMRLHSRSFDKFYRESLTAYQDWMETLEQQEA